MPKSDSLRLLIVSLISATAINFLLPITYNGDLLSKPMFSNGNPILIVPYALLISIFLSSASKKDVENSGKVIIDKPKDIPRTIIKSILEIFFGIILFLIIPAFLCMYLYWGLNIQLRLSVFIVIIYLAILVGIGKKYYWAKLYN